MPGELPVRRYYRGPVAVDPVRPEGGIDLSDVARAERRAIRAKQPLPEIRDRDWFGLAVAVIGLIIAATMLIPGLAHLAKGAPDNRPQAEARR